MIKNYLLIAARNLMKNKVFSLINILGLTIGITVCLMIFLYIRTEFAVDDFHVKKDRIFRVMRSFDSEKASAPYLSGPYAPALLNDYPGQIKSAIRVLRSNALVTVADKSFNEKEVLLVDPGFFNMFSFQLLQGNAASVLKEPGSVVLTETTARKYFGNENAMGKIIEVDRNTKLKVTGIAKNVGANSHLQFDLIAPLSNYYEVDWFKVWINNSMFTYVELADKKDVATLEKQFPAFMQKYMGKQMAKMGVTFALSLTPLPDIYFEKHSTFDSAKHGDRSVVFIFMSIGVLILVIACINFMNLSTIRAVERSKEVGLRKVMGALRSHLLLQFVGESVLLTLLSCVLATGLLQFVMPAYNELVGYNLEAGSSAGPIIGFLAALVLVVGILAGSYPAFFMSSFSPIQALKGKLKMGKGGAFLRQSLVVVQFSITVLLIIGTIIIMNQMSYMKNRELGYEKDHTLIVKIDNEGIGEGRFVFKRQLEANPAISGVSLMSGEPGGFFDMHGFEVEGQQDIFKSRTEFADFEFVKTLGLKIIAGRDLSSSFATDSSDAVLINRKAAEAMGYSPEQAIGKWIKNSVRDDHKRRVTGVVENFNYLSLKENIEPLIISPKEDSRLALVKIKGGNISAGIDLVKKQYEAVATGYPFEYTFLDQQFDKLYRDDLKQQTIMGIFAGLAIFIASMGLFGLASFTTNRRLREIGVRKVLGSTPANIVLLLSRDLLKPVIIATLIAIPVAYTLMTNWLQNFAFKTELSWWIFALAAVITFAIAILTVGLKAVKASMINPISNLRSE